MKIQCDVCEKAATVVCCADEAALCASCDIEIHAANKLASKHQRLMLHSLPNRLPRCDICQEKVAFIFCVEDRALFCQDCDESIHIAGSLTGNHQRFLATGIQVALNSIVCNNAPEIDNSKPSNHKPQPVIVPKGSTGEEQVSATTTAAATLLSSPWAVDEFLQLSDCETNDKKDSSLGFEELEWFSDVGLFGEQIPRKMFAAAEVPELPLSVPNNYHIHRPTTFENISKKPRIEIAEDGEEEFFVVPDLG